MNVFDKIFLNASKEDFEEKLNEANSQNELEMNTVYNKLKEEVTKFVYSRDAAAYDYIDYMKGQIAMAFKLGAINIHEAHDLADILFREMK